MKIIKKSFKRRNQFISKILESQLITASLLSDKITKKNKNQRRKVQLSNLFHKTY